MNTSKCDSPCARGAQEKDQRGPSEAEETTVGYDRTAAEFAARWGSLRLGRSLRAFADRLAGQRRVLDLGCGPGRDIGFLTELGCQVAGLDRSLGMLRQARDKLPNAFLVWADLRHLPFAPASFDGVWACASLLHLRRSELLNALAGIARVLVKPSGTLFLALKGGEGERWITNPDGQRFFFTYYQPTELETALHGIGFQIQECWVAPNQAGQVEPWLNVVARL